MSTLNVLYQSSSLYAIPSAISLGSLYENNKDIDELNVWVIDNGLTEEDKKGFLSVGEKYGRKVFFWSGEEMSAYLEKEGVAKYKGAYATFLKLFACCHLGDIKSLLYIDSDTLILRSLKGLVDYDFEGNALAMVGSAMTGAMKDFFGVESWFNAGIVFFNVEYWKEHGVEKALLDIIKNDKKKKYTIIADESLINSQFKGKIKKLPLEYNCESSWWLWGWNKKLYEKMNFANGKEYYTVREVEEAFKNPIIAHYIDLTTGRPWDRYNDNPHRNNFALYRKKIHEWKKIDIPCNGIGNDVAIIQLLKLVVKKVIPFSYRSKMGFMQHDNYWKERIGQLQDSN